MLTPSLRADGYAAILSPFLQPNGYCAVLTLSLQAKGYSAMPMPSLETDGYSAVLTLSILNVLLDIPLLEFMYLAFTRMPGESYHRRFRSLLFLLV